MMRKSFFTRFVITGLIILLSITIAGWLITNTLDSIAREDVKNDALASLSVIAVHLEGEIKKIEGAVFTLAGSPWISPALIDPNRRNIERANSVLDRYNAALGVSVTYLMDTNGITIASSNRKEIDSFVGKSYRFRPYFIEALDGKRGRYFALGVTSLKKGFYASAPVRDSSGRIIGVVVMKKDLNEIEQFLQKYPYSFFVNRDGVIFLSGKPEYSLKTLWTIEEEKKYRLIASRQFGTGPFEPLMSTEPLDDMMVVLDNHQFLVSRKTIDKEGWSLILFTPTDRITIYRAVGIISTASLCLLTGGFFLILFIRERTALQIQESAERLREERNKARMYLEIAGVIIVALDAQGTVTLINRKGCEILGYEDKEIIGKNWFEHFLPAREQKQAKTVFENLMKGNITSYARVENTVRTKSGEERLILWQNALLNDTEGNIIGTLSSGEDITEQKKAENLIRQMAYYDPVTGIPNRRLFYDRLTMAIEHAKRYIKHLSVMLLDLDKFKTINDTMGHDVGDLLLKGVSERLTGLVRSSDTVARLGGDEFVVLLTEITSPKDVSAIAERILLAFQEPFTCNGHSLSITISIGIAMYPEDGENIETLLKHADNAMYMAKERGRNTYTFYRNGES